MITHRNSLQPERAQSLSLNVLWLCNICPLLQVVGSADRECNGDTRHRQHVRTRYSCRTRLQETALRWCLRLANLADAPVQCDVGIFYEDGLAVNRISPNVLADELAAIIRWDG